MPSKWRGARYDSSTAWRNGAGHRRPDLCQSGLPNVWPTGRHKARFSAIDGRTARHASYATSQRTRKRIEEAFGWIKTIAGLRKSRFIGRAKTDWAFTFAVAAYNLVRLPKLLAPAAGAG